MTLTSLSKAPFPWFGGKWQAAPTVWALLGDVDHYVEPFAGTLAVLLERPHPANRSYHSETVNDADGLIANVWRAILAGLRGRQAGPSDADGWTVHEWYKQGYLTGGMGNVDGTSQQHRERLWASPHCLTPTTVVHPEQGELWSADWETG